MITSERQTRVLCIDDEELIRLTIADYLEDSGYVVYPAEDGSVGLGMFHQTAPDIVLVDLRMPDVDGLQVLSRIRQEAPEIPVIVVSGTGILSDVIEALRLGAWDYIAKPIEDLAILELAITQCLERAQLIHENREYKENLEQLVQQRTEALQKSEERLKLALEAANDGLWDHNLQTNSTYHSPRWFTMLGYEPGEFPQSLNTWISLLHPDDKGYVLSKMEEYLDKGGEYNLEFRMKTKNGEYRWIHSRGKIVEWDQNGKPIRMLGTHTDITDRKRAEESIRRMNEELERRVAERTIELQESLATLKRAQKQLVESEKMAALGALVSGISHEINTPIGVSVTAASYLELQTQKFMAQYGANALKRSDLDQYVKVAQESTAIMLSNLNRAAHLIKSFKQVAVDRSTEEKRRFNLKDYLEDILLSLRPHLKKTQHTVTVNCPDHLELTSYPGAFSQIISNLIMNSLIHGFEDQEHGTITIDIAVNPLSLHLTYRDNGKGIADEHLPKIFEPFFTTKRSQDNTGLGMHIVYNLVTQQLNGTIACESARGKGATFSIAVPTDGLNIEADSNP
jgi:PAS domain S-box-containing protein